MVILRWYVFRILVVLVKLSVLAKWFARKTPLRKPNQIWRDDRPQRQCRRMFLGGRLFHCLTVALHNIFRNPMAWYSLLCWSTVKHQPNQAWPSCSVKVIIDLLFCSEIAPPDPEDVLPRDKCEEALRTVRRARWFEVTTDTSFYFWFLFNWPVFPQSDFRVWPFSHGLPKDQ